MMLALALLALNWNSQAGQDPRLFNFGGQPVTLTMPTPSQDGSPTNEVAAWSGWGGLAGSNPVFDKPYFGAGDWSQVEKDYLAAPKQASVWRVKIVLLASVDALYHWGDGPLEDRRNTITGDRFTETLNAIPQFVALVASMTGGKVHVVPDVLIDPEPSRDVASSQPMAFPVEYLDRYLAGKINGGQYESDDGVYRGPYHSVLFIDPCSRNSLRLELPQGRYDTRDFKIDATPAEEVAFDSSGGGSEGGGLAISMFDAWTESVAQRAKSQGLPLVTGSLESANWTSLCDLGETPTATLLSRLATHPGGNYESITLPAGLRQPTYKTANVKLSIVKDPAKGPVLEFTETNATRFGGAVLAHGPTPIDPARTPSLAVTYKSSSDRPIAFGLHSAKGGTRWVSLGPDPEAGDISIASTSWNDSLPVQTDSAWHTVTISLKGNNSDPIDEIRIGASPSGQVLTPDSNVPYTWDFAEFKLGSDPATPPIPAPTESATSPDPRSRCLAAFAFGKDGKASPELAALLKDPDDTVVLNAVSAYSNVVDSYAEPRLIELAGSPSPRISEFALKALDHQNTPTATAAILKMMKSGFEYSREVAAKLIAAKHDPKSAEELVVLLAGRLWHTRLAAVEALAEIPGPASETMRLAILPQDDPAIKCAVIEHTDPQSDTDMRKMLWTSVNEPSDLVRAESDEKLIESNLPNMRTEGLKGVRDDSWWTRVLVLEYLKAHPNEAARGAIKLALADSSSRVRAAAIDALSGLQSVTVEDLTTCLNDPSPAVDKALIALSKARSLPLPQATLEMFKKSPDATVAAGAGS